MAEPEISRRCPSCGASIRVQAFFCPQCGEELKQQKSKQEDPSPRAREGDTAPLENLFDQTIPIIRIPEGESTSSASETIPLSPMPTPTRRETSHTTLGEVGAKIHRATTRARGVEEDMMQRVQKLREISSVVMEEASYDPSLRFVLVAAALFMLFLVILILNKLIG